MKYGYRCTGEVVSEEEMYEIACQNIEWSDIANNYEGDFAILISMLQELHRLGSPLFERIWERALESYIEEFFEEVEVEEDDE